VRVIAKEWYSLDLKAGIMPSTSSTSYNLWLNPSRARGFPVLGRVVMSRRSRVKRFLSISHYPNKWKISP
jgi:hypothetical protein